MLPPVPTSSSGKWQSNTREWFEACFVTSTTKFGVDTISGCKGKSWLESFSCPYLMFDAHTLNTVFQAKALPPNISETITVLPLTSPSADFCCPWSTSSSKFGGMLLLTLNVTVILENKRRVTSSSAHASFSKDQPITKCASLTFLQRLSWRVWPLCRSSPAPILQTS